jgi:hypothetical protein
MAINTTFNGATIFKPGAYSRTSIDLGGGFPLGPAGLIAVIGEADAGTPGASEVNIADVRYTADQLVTIRDKYRTGNITDAAAFLFSPAADAAIPGGAQTVWFYKTNASVRATLAVDTTYGTVRAREWGTGGNRVTFASTLVAETPAVTVGTAVDETLIVAGTTFTLAFDGGAAATQNVYTQPATAPADNADLAVDLADIANWSLGAVPTEVSIVVGGSDGASTITITQTADATAHQNGWGRSFEIMGLSGGDATLLGLTAGQVEPAVEPSATVAIEQKRDATSESEIVGGNIVMEIGHDGSVDAVAPTVSVTSSSIVLRHAGVDTHTFLAASFATLKDLVDEINLATYAGWTASISDAIYNQLGVDTLDDVTDVGALSASGATPARLKKDSDEVADFFELSITASMESQATKGLPDATSETPLAGGAKGATTSADIVAALEKFEKFHVNSIVPLFSRDATDDITDDLTDSGSTYTIAGIHQSVKTHISLMKTTKKRSERQGYMSMKDSYTASKTQAGVLADGRMQLAIQDIRQTDSQGTIKWFQPWAMSCLLAGARGGAPIGEPLTFKFLNASGIRHTAQSMSTPEEDVVIDFDPDLQTDDAIQAGLTFMEAPQTGGFRVVVDNTTYGRDNNFVWNRGNVLYAADIVAFNFRNALEARFVGRKNTVSVTDIEGFATSTLTNFLAQGITVSTPDAPQGFKNLIVRLEGNTIYVEVVIKLVEGIDFVLADITIQRATA